MTVVVVVVAVAAASVHGEYWFDIIDKSDESWRRCGNKSRRI
jgi:hypothetical protein